jgi:REP element-mobilizing transposase RayT
MARPLRIEYEGAVYQITVCGNARENIFLDDEGRKSFLAILGSVVERFNWLCHAYCLMDNHYHLLLETPDANLSQGMRQLNGVYTQAFNRRHDRVGHLLQGRFKSILIEKEAYLLEVARYIVLNPVRAKLVSHPRYWKWSSYTTTAGIRQAPQFLTTDWILAQFGSEKEEAQQAYRRFVAEGKGVSLWEGLQGGILLGSDPFVKQIMPLLRSKEMLKDLSKAQRFATRPSLSTLFQGAKKAKEERNERIRKAYLEYGYTLSEIGNYLGLHYSTISRIARKEQSQTTEKKSKDKG